MGDVCVPSFPKETKINEVGGYFISKQKEKQQKKIACFRRKKRKKVDNLIAI